MATSPRRRPAPEVVEAPLKYLAAAGAAPPVYVASVGGGDATLHQGDYVMQSVAIRNGRLCEAGAEGFGLDREGFMLAAQASAVRDFYDDDQIAAVYEPEVKALVRRVTGAARVEIFDHTRRAAALAVQQARGIREPASIVHNDYTARSGPQRLRDQLCHRQRLALDRRPGAERAAGALRRRQRGARGPGPGRAPGQGPHRRDPAGRLQPGPPLVLLPRDGAGRGAADQDLRLGERRPRPLHHPHLLRGPRRPGRRAANALDSGLT
jgi:hypothetical protein